MPRSPSNLGIRPGDGAAARLSVPVQPVFRLCWYSQKKKLENCFRTCAGRAFARGSAIRVAFGEANKSRVMKFWKKLQNPFVLVGQGFVLGGFLFFATQNDSVEATPSAPVQAGSVLTSL